MPEHHTRASCLLKINTGGRECRRRYVIQFNSDMSHYFIIYLDGS